MENTDFIFNACHQAWRDTHNWDTCKLNRREYGEFLLNYLLGESGEFVLNLNGAWGSGKTEFLKRLYVAALERGHPVIYINAWESDFSQQPLVVVASELLEQLNSFNEGIGETFDKLKGALGRIIRGSAIAGAAALSKYATGEVEYGKAFVENILQADTPPEELMNGLSKNHLEQKKTMAEIRERLTALAEVLATNRGAKLPILVLVDELDRCRPTYAIEILEVIKHFFSVDKLVFVVATDTDQLSHSIKAVYGEGFDADTYLRRFFQQRAKLPAPNLAQYILSKYCEDDFTLGNKSYLFGLQWLTIVTLLADSARGSVSIRALNNVANKAKALVRYFRVQPYANYKPISILILILGLLEHEKNGEQFLQGDYLLNKKENNEQDGDLNDSISGSTVGEALMYAMEFGCYSEDEDDSFFVTTKGLANSMAEWLIKFNQTHELGNDYWLWSDYKKMIELSDVLTL